MDRDNWKDTIIEQMIKKGLGDDIDNPNVDTLAEIMEERDETYAEYHRSGRQPVVMHINKGGAENMEKNPLLRIWIDLNQLSLTYWRELGLTPSSYKKLTEVPLSQKKAEDPIESKILAILQS